MKFKLSKDLVNGRYFVRVELIEFSDRDKQQSEKFGIPTIILRIPDGNKAEVKVTLLHQVNPFGFYKQEEAEQYAEQIKSQLYELKQKWSLLQDTWSHEEII